VLEAGFDNLADAWQRGQQLTEFRQQPAFNDLLTAFNRVNNLAKKSTDPDIKAELLQEPAEKSLYEAYTAFDAALAKHLAHKDYAAGLNEIAQLLPAINDFFNQIMVMAEDEGLRNNRLALLYNLAEKMKTMADFSKIVA
jgi:glycyl-tRNA synthetase beta chain